MTSDDRTFETSLSAEHIFSALYQLKIIHDTERIVSVSFKDSLKGLTVQGDPTVAVPVKITVTKGV